ncbi:MAG TPA: hypothetical protein ACFYDZ_10395 [Candidatus Brocadiaceae bacterium]
MVKLGGKRYEQIINALGPSFEYRVKERVIKLIQESLAPIPETVCETEPGIIDYKGEERHKHLPYTPDEQAHIDKLVAILRGANRKNARAIRENIDAFHETKDIPISIPGEESQKEVKRNNA